MSKKLSVVVSVYNEEQALPLFCDAALPILRSIPWDYELLFVDDGSTDDSLAVLRALSDEDPKIRYISFSRNFGHEAAMIAGIDYADGDGIVCMDSDLQHPPEYLPAIVEEFEAGADVINMVRTGNHSAGILKNITSSGFYWVLNHISGADLVPGASDFFAVSARAAEVLRKNYREKARFLRGYVQDIGFNRVSIEYEAAERAAGKSKYSLKKLFSFSVRTLVCFSDLPLKLGIGASIVAALFGLIVLVYTLITRQGAPSGYATIVILNCFMFAVLFLIVGIIGEYLAVMFGEQKDRPLYIVEETNIN